VLRKLRTAQDSIRDEASASQDTPANSTVLTYIIVAQARTGSTMLADRLRLAGLGTPYEYLHPQMMNLLWHRLGPKSARIDLQEYMDIVRLNRTTTDGVFGIKCLYTQLLRQLGKPTAIREFILSFDRILLLNRRNKLAQAISAVRAEQTGRWTSQLASTDGAQATYDPLAVSERIHRFIAQDRELAAMKLAEARTVLRFTYEELTNSPNQIWANIERFLGANPGSLSVATAVLQRQRDTLSKNWEQQYLAFLKDGHNMHSDGT